MVGSVAPLRRDRSAQPLLLGCPRPSQPQPPFQSFREGQLVCSDVPPGALSPCQSRGAAAE